MADWFDQNAPNGAVLPQSGNTGINGGARPAMPMADGSSDLARFQRDYWAPDRDQVLAQMQTQQGQQGQQGQSAVGIGTSPSMPGEPGYGGSGIPAKAGGYSGTPGSDQWMNSVLQSVQSTDDPGYWKQQMASDPKVAAGDPSALAYWEDRMRRGNGSALVKNGQLSLYGGGGQSASGIGGGFGSFAQGYDKTFTAPTAEDARNTPGYQFTMDQGIKGLDQSAAARGSVLSGGHNKDLMQYAQGLADTTYGNTYNRALGEYQNAYNVFRNNQNDVWGRYNDLSGRGTQAASSATM